MAIISVLDEDSDMYQYATSTHLGRISPAPPAAVSPRHRPQELTDDGALKRRSYATLVYQVPSLNNVDSANRVSFTVDNFSEKPEAWVDLKSQW